MPDQMRKLTTLMRSDNYRRMNQLAHQYFALTGNPAYSNPSYSFRQSSRGAHVAEHGFETRVRFAPMSIPANQPRASNVCQRAPLPSRPSSAQRLGPRVDRRSRAPAWQSGPRPADGVEPREFRDLFRSIARTTALATCSGVLVPRPGGGAAPLSANIPASRIMPGVIRETPMPLPRRSSRRLSANPRMRELCGPV